MTANNTVYRAKDDKTHTEHLQHTLVVNDDKAWKMMHHLEQANITKQNSNIKISETATSSSSNIKRNVILLWTIIIAIIIVVGVIIIPTVQKVAQRNSPEKVTIRFLSGEFDDDDVSPDGRYHITDWDDPVYLMFNPPGFDVIWLRNQANGDIEIREMVIRDGERANSKEVTIWYTQRYDVLEAPSGNQNAPIEEWIATGERNETKGIKRYLFCNNA